ncbi:MAG: hypothetical protein HYY45_00600 [Deltaproteobacteria bacterium]|nr:hypothetical protein [Deltaproteobacteria bacterium]
MTRKIALDLFIVSFLSLFFEMLLIRYIPSQVRIIGYYTNFVLIASFLGLGAGCLLARYKIRVLNFFPIFFLVLLLVVLLFKDVRVIGPTTDLIFLNYDRQKWIINLYYVIPLFYVLITLSFVPFGQEIGTLMREMTSLSAYSINISGSILGIATFSLLSLFSSPPTLWLALSLPFLLWLYRTRGVWRAVNITILILAMVVVFFSTENALWSPYHKITLKELKYGQYPWEQEPSTHVLDVWDGDKSMPENVGFNIFVNGSYYQTPVALSDEVVQKYPALKYLRKQYDIPYRFGPREDVLILGGGSGNDAAAAMRNGARRIDVVDIEPLIVRIGREKHPDRPYADPRVTVHINDARSYLRNTKKQYDLIVYALLDSQTVLSTMASARLDSYVYTVESLADAKKHLKKNGIAVLLMSNHHRWNAERMYLMLREAFTMSPYFWDTIGFYGYSMVVGEGLERYLPQQPVIEVRKDTRVTTDDWPFFYLQNNFIPQEYLITLLLVVLVSTLVVFLCNLKTKIGIDMHFFYLGCAFMLLETKSITSLALLFSSTWIINSIVVFSILVMILLANLYVSRAKEVKVEYYYALLGTAITLNFLIPLKMLHFENVFLKVILSGTLIASPLFFAGIIFADSFKKVSSPDYSLGSNILGGVVGGVLEYQSLVTGFNYLFLLAFLFYLLSYLVVKNDTRVLGIGSRTMTLTP